MNRRNFLGLIAATPVALAALPDEVPLAKVIDDGINPDWDGTFQGVSFIEDGGATYRYVRFPHGANVGDFLVYCGKYEVTPGSWTDPSLAGVSVASMKPGRCGMMLIRGVRERIPYGGL